MSKSDDSFEYIDIGKLKTVSHKDIEKAISIAITELVDEELKCSIQKIKYEGFSAHINISLTSPLNLDFLKDKKFR